MQYTCIWSKISEHICMGHYNQPIDNTPDLESQRPTQGLQQMMMITAIASICSWAVTCACMQDLNYVRMIPSAATIYPITHVA
jgi:hypothetical protein